MRSTTRRVATPVRLIGGPTLVIGVGGLRLLTDPAAGRPGPDDGELRITGVPAQPEPGEVTGFILSGVDTPTIYLSGGNVSPRTSPKRWRNAVRRSISPCCPRARRSRRPSPVTRPPRSWARPPSS